MIIQYWKHSNEHNGYGYIFIIRMIKIIIMSINCSHLPVMACRSTNNQHLHRRERPRERERGRERDSIKIFCPNLWISERIKQREYSRDETDWESPAVTKRQGCEGWGGGFLSMHGRGGRGCILMNIGWVFSQSRDSFVLPLFSCFWSAAFSTGEMYGMI